MVGCLVIAELVLESLRPAAVNTERIKRSIRLREHRPASSSLRERPIAFLQNCDGPAKKQAALRIDIEGFIEPSRVHLNADLEIVFLGGSTTECMYVDENIRFPYLAGRKLEASLSVTVNSYNAGNSGNHSMHSNHILLAKVLPRQPDMVVLMHCINDLKYLTYTGGYWSDYDDHLLQRAIVVTTRSNREQAKSLAPWPGVKQFMSHTFPELYQRALTIKQRIASTPDKRNKPDEWEQFRHRPLQYDLDALSQQFARSLTLFCTTCRTYKIEPVLMTQAHRSTAPTSKMLQQWKVATAGMNYDFEKFAQHYAHFNNVIRQVAEKHKILLVDLEKTIPPKHEFMYDLLHFTNHGSRFVAQIVSDQLEHQLKKQHSLSKSPVSSHVPEYTVAEHSNAGASDAE